MGVAPLAAAAPPHLGGWRWPAVIVMSAASMLAAAAVLWGTTPGPVDVPATPVELAVTLSLVGGFLLWRRRRNRVAAVIAATGVLFALASMAAAVLAHAAAGGSLPAPVVQPALAVAWLASALPVPWLLVVLWFPDGGFIAAGWRRLFVVLSGGAVLVGLAGYLFGPPGRLPAILGVDAPTWLAGPFGASERGWLAALADAMVLMPVVGLPALVIRYRRADLVARQQLRWLLAAVVVTVVASVFGSVLSHGPAAVHLLGLVVAAAAQPLPAFAIAVAVLRYRLWDIDIVVSRTLGYAVLWTVLSVLLLVPALVSGYLVGGPGALAGVGVALLVTLAFQPVRRRLQDAVDARVYGRRRRGLQRLLSLGELLRNAVAVGDVGPRVAAAIAEALQVPWAAVWVYIHAGDAGALHPAGARGVEALLVPLSTDSAATLRTLPALCTAEEFPLEQRQRLPDPAGVFAPLVAGGELVGLLACGHRERNPLDERDLESLARFADECALGLRGLRLDAELRARISEIRLQAGELRSSRQRLVRVQDDERRRIERDLHDGLQQQLVGLAARLRRLALASDPMLRAECERLAGEAEDAVFSLQDLARGIFPAVLSDQGLAAALRTHAGASPLPVRVEIEPGIDARRFAPDLEAALYFVALEAFTNVTKHAPDAAVTVALRSAGPERQLVLDVHDDGPGLPREGTSNGTGLVNMRDRVSAVGGSLRLESRPGAGTWLRATVPLDGDIAAPHCAEADSRR